jgi:hypothetical protein
LRVHKWVHSVDQAADLARAGLDEGLGRCASGARDRSNPAINLQQRALIVADAGDKRAARRLAAMNRLTGCQAAPVLLKTLDTKLNANRVLVLENRFSGQACDNA